MSANLFRTSRGHSGIFDAVGAHPQPDGDDGHPQPDGLPRHEGLSCRAHSLGVATSPALRPRMHVQSDFDIKGAVRTKKTVCCPPGGPSRNSGQYRERSRWLAQPGWYPGRTGRTEGYAAYPPRIPGQRAPTGLPSPGRLPPSASAVATTSTAEKPLFPALSAVDAKI